MRREGPAARDLVDVTSELFGMPLVHDVMEITAWDPPRMLEVVHRGQFPGTALSGSSRPNGHDVRLARGVQPPLGPIGELVFSLVVGPHLRRVWAARWRT